MNKLPRPEVDDAAALQLLAENERLSSFPHLRAAVQSINDGYEQYIAVRGDAFHVHHVPLNAEVGGYLKKHYASPPAVLDYITTLRLDAEQRVCPMCGSMHRGTLDHLLPKENYAAFSIFSQNLIPACKCNVRRGQTVIGAGQGERILHPYFDDCLAERLIAARFEDLAMVPRISLRILLEREHPRYSAVAFHVEKIVSTSAILEYVKDKWVQLCQKPKLAVRALGAVPASVERLREILTEELSLTDESHGGQNNWNSVFVAGLLDTDVSLWLFERLNAPERLQDGPLVEV
ncbi:hypothetical protein [Burkholderia sp. Bp8963]|uniref:hypothetical protein n=1 Tax=Burkholderia sp. Bp8963 TaxID=2184547 RepID=UPI000F5916E6|nr:hypothetical protein [Burkholderia sp. Bp8963]